VLAVVDGIPSECRAMQGGERAGGGGKELLLQETQGFAASVLFLNR
jgi:hypothetical protein